MEVLVGEATSMCQPPVEKAPATAVGGRRHAHCGGTPPRHQSKAASHCPTVHANPPPPPPPTTTTRGDPPRESAPTPSNHFVSVRLSLHSCSPIRPPLLSSVCQRQGAANCGLKNGTREAPSAALAPAAATPSLRRASSLQLGEDGDALRRMVPTVEELARARPAAQHRSHHVRVRRQPLLPPHRRWGNGCCTCHRCHHGRVGAVKDHEGHLKARHVHSCRARRCPPSQRLLHGRRPHQNRDAAGTISPSPLPGLPPPPTQGNAVEFPDEPSEDAAPRTTAAS